MLKNSSNRRCALGLFFILLVPLCARADNSDFDKLCETGTPNEIAQAIKSGADVNAKDKTGADANAEDERGADVDGKDKRGANVTGRDKRGANANGEGEQPQDKGAPPGIAVGSTPLFHAVLGNRDTAAVVALINAGADVNAKDARGRTPLQMAIMRRANAPEVIAALVKAGADVNARDSRGQSPLDAAVMFGRDPAVVAALIKAGADVNAAGGRRGETPLAIAVEGGENTEVIAALIKAGANVNGVDGRRGETPLAIALESRKSAEVIAALIKGGANVNAAGGRRGETPLAIAVEARRDAQVITELVKAGADVNVKAMHGTPLLIFLAESSRNDKTANNADTMAVLLGLGADVNATDRHGMTALDWARKNNDARMVELLVAAAKSPATQPSAARSIPAGERTQTGTDASAGEGNRKGRGGLENGEGRGGRADQKKNRADGSDLENTQLFRAVFSKDPTALETLIQGGAKVNVVNGAGDSPLILAVKLRREKAVADLIKAGADLTAGDRQGVTALEWARRLKNAALVELLQSAAANPATTQPSAPSATRPAK